MHKIIALICLSASIIFPQSKSDLFGFWLLDSNSELLKISSDSIVIYSGFFQDGKYDSVKKEFQLNNDKNTMNCEIFNDQLILSKSEAEADTLSMIYDEPLLPNSTIWIHTENDKRILLILHKDGFVKIGIVLILKIFPYRIINDHIIFLTQEGKIESKLLLDSDQMKLFPISSEEVYVYDRLK